MDSIETKEYVPSSHGRSVAIEVGIAALAAVLLAFLAAARFEGGTDWGEAAVAAKVRELVG